MCTHHNPLSVHDCGGGTPVLQIMEALTQALTDEEFVDRLGCPRQAFGSLTPWKQRQLLRLAGLQEKKLELGDFEVVRLLGKGAFGRVSLGVRRDTGEKFAIKTMNKRMLVAVKQHHVALAEHEVLRTKQRHPCMVSMHAAFQDEQSLHMVLDYMPGGDLYDRIEAEQRIPLDRARLYAAEVAAALCHLHDVLCAIYRDLKPENVLLDAAGHAKLTDFGLVTTRRGSGGMVMGKSFVGTLEYMAPEVMRQQQQLYSKAVDWWGLGVLLFEMLYGQTPFCADDQNEVRRAVLATTPVVIPAETDDGAAAFMRALLERDVDARLGGGLHGSRAIQLSSFWTPLTFEGVVNRTYEPGWAPLIECAPGSERASANRSSSSRSQKVSSIEGPPADERASASSASRAEIEDGSGADELDGSSDDDEGADELDGSSEEASDDDDDEWHALLASAPPPTLGQFANFSFMRSDTWQPEDGPSKPTRLVAKRDTRTRLRQASNALRAVAAVRGGGKPTRLDGGGGGGGSVQAAPLIAVTE